MTLQHVTFFRSEQLYHLRVPIRLYRTRRSPPHPVAHLGWSQAVVPSNQGGPSYQANPLPLDISFVPWSCKVVFGWVLFDELIGSRDI